MRIILVLTLLAAWLPASASGAEAIAPGMGLDTVKKTLHRHAYEVDTRKYGLPIVPRDKNTDLEFCRIDRDITLVLGYDRRTKKVTSLGLYFIPDNRTAKLQVTVREALEMRFEEEGVYTLKLRRKTDKEPADN